MQSRTVKIVEGGKLIIPAQFRRELEMGIGDTVVIELVDGELRVRSRKADLRRLQDRVRQIGRREGAEQGSVADKVSDHDTVKIANG